MQVRPMVAQAFPATSVEPHSAADGSPPSEQNVLLQSGRHVGGSGGGTGQLPSSVTQVPLEQCTKAVAHPPPGQGWHGTGPAKQSPSTKQLPGGGGAMQLPLRSPPHGPFAPTQHAGPRLDHGQKAGLHEAAAPPVVGAPPVASRPPKLDPPVASRPPKPAALEPFAPAPENAPEPPVGPDVLVST